MDDKSLTRSVEAVASISVPDAQAGGPTQPARELSIDICPHGWNHWSMQGTRAQLEAEGAIPAGTVWPERGASTVEWQRGPLSFTLRRTRPEDLRGPRRLWINGDWWELRCIDPRQTWASKQIAARVREIDALRRAPQYGLLNRLSSAKTDVAYQAFRARLPGLQRRPGDSARR